MPYGHDETTIMPYGMILAGATRSLDVAIFREKYSRGKRRKGSERKCDNLALL
jgi:hypothetical protein